MESTSGIEQEIQGGAAEQSVLKKMPRESIHLQFVGDLIIAKTSEPNLDGLFKRYQFLFEYLANLDKKTRLVNYKVLNSLMLTSFAKKASSLEEKRAIFNYKNNLFLDLTENPKTRAEINLSYLVSKNYRVLQFCPSCIERNKAQIPPLKQYKWRHCKNCTIDRDYFNVISLETKTAKGYSRIFLGNDLLSKVSRFRPVKPGKLADQKEEARYERFLYSPRNLDAISYESVIKMYEKLIQK